MSRIGRFIRFVAVAFMCYLVFGMAGELSAFGILSLASFNDVVGWTLYALGLALSVAVVLGVWLFSRSGGLPSPFIRTSLAGFAGFFCWQWAVGGTPDWSPLPLLIGAAVCGTSAVLVLRLGRATERVPAVAD